MSRTETAKPGELVAVGGSEARISVGRRAPVDPWGSVDLTAAYRGERPQHGGIVLKTSDGSGLFPPGLNCLFGDSGDGKSWVATVAAAQCLEDSEHVLWVTYEDPNELEFVSRIRSLGVTETQLDNLDFVRATEPLESGVGCLGELLRRRSTRLMVLDSLGEALAMSDVDEDRDIDFTKWNQMTLRVLIDASAETYGETPGEHLAVLILDHSTKSRERSLWPSGTKRKRAAITGMMCRLDVSAPLGRGQRGDLKLVVAKDRTGHFQRGQIAATITIDAQTNPYLVAVEPQKTSGTRRRNAESRIRSALADSSEPLRARDIATLVNSSTAIRDCETELELNSIKNVLTKMAGDGALDRRADPAATSGAKPSYLYSLSTA
jgi:hypothetical protein